MQSWLDDSACCLNLGITVRSKEIRIAVQPQSNAVQVSVGKLCVIVSLLHDIVQSGGPSAELARHGPRIGPRIVLGVGDSIKEGVFSQVAIGGIPETVFLFPAAFPQIGCFGFFIVTRDTVPVQHWLNQTRETEWVRAIDIRLNC